MKLAVNACMQASKSKFTSRKVHVWSNMESWMKLIYEFLASKAIYEFSNSVNAQRH